MGDEILSKLAGRVNRRSFLRGSALAAAALGLGAASSGISFAQDPQPSGGKQEGDKKNEQQDEDKQKEDKQNADKQGEKSPDPPIDKTTYLDDSGRSYRICPVCGSNMYQQDHTWTCENCGFTYTE